MRATSPESGPRGYYILSLLRTVLLLSALLQAVWLGFAAWSMSSRGTLSTSSFPQLDPHTLGTLSDVASAAIYSIQVLRWLLPAVVLVLLGLAVSHLHRGRLDLTPHAESGVFASVIGAIMILMGTMNTTVFLLSRTLGQQGAMPDAMWLYFIAPIISTAAWGCLVETWRRHAAPRVEASVVDLSSGPDAGRLRILAMVAGSALMVGAVFSAVRDGLIVSALLQTPGNTVTSPPPFATLRKLIEVPSQLIGFAGAVSLGAFIIAQRRRLAAVVQRTLHGSMAARVLAGVLMLQAALVVVTLYVHVYVYGMDGTSARGLILISHAQLSCMAIAWFAIGVMLLRYARLSRAATQPPRMPIEPARSIV